MFEETRVHLVFFTTSLNSDATVGNGRDAAPSCGPVSAWVVEMFEGNC